MKVKFDPDLIDESGEMQDVTVILTDIPDLPFDQFNKSDQLN